MLNGLQLNLNSPSNENIDESKIIYSHEANTKTILIFPNHIVLGQINDNEP